MNTFKQLITISIILFFQIAALGSDTLQNGLNGYNGQIDTWNMEKYGIPKSIENPDQHILVYYQDC